MKVQAPESSDCAIWGQDMLRITGSVAIYALQKEQLSRATLHGGSVSWRIQTANGISSNRVWMLPVSQGDFGTFSGSSLSVSVVCQASSDVALIATGRYGVRSPQVQIDLEDYWCP
ncbi:hypothetical protein NIG5292_02893 [Nereida ignava]|uniref:Uncharacterized protein n=1 Tax=Nereida ignava TaxID=282199 RepID=A0A0U1NPX5_9RHOB|nr:hypothetical protein NIG5292_02893 [Nereida ignava]